MDISTLQLEYLTNSAEQIINRLDKLTLSLGKANVPEVTQSQALYTLREAVKLKYGDNVAYSTISTNYALMPCCNSNYIISAGKRMWKKEYIDEWLLIEDKDIERYAEKYNVPLTGKAEKYKHLN